MGRKKRDHAAPRVPRPARPAADVWRVRLTPDWLLFGLAFAGLLLTGYLTATALGNDAPAFCASGSGCDVVQHSRWSTLLGIPIALWGFGLYLLLAAAALFASEKVKSWGRIWTLALIGVAVSTYLTAAAAIALDAFCAWCLVSFALLLAIFVIASVRRPSTAPGIPWRRWWINHAIVLVALIGVLHAAQSGLLVRPEDARLKALAEHLDARGAKFYGAYWCPKCTEQKELFGRSAERLPYVECSPNGRGGAVAFACVSANVEGYPTWVIRNRPYSEVLQPEQLARRSGFDWKGFKPPTDD